MTEKPDKLAEELTYELIEPGELYEWLTDLLRSASQNRLAKELGVSRPVLGLILGGSNRLRGKTLKAIARRMGYTDREMINALNIRFASDRLQPSRLEGCVMIPVIQLSGAVPRLDHHIALRRKWLERFGDQIEAAIVAGESMAPTLSSGDIVLYIPIEIYSEGLYLIRVNKTVMVKRLTLLPENRALLQSDNPAFASFEIDLEAPPFDFYVVGRIVGRLSAM